MIRAATLAALALSIAAPAMAGLDLHALRDNQTHKFYRDQDIPVITAILKSQLDGPYMTTGIASFKIEPQEKFPDDTVDITDMGHDIVDVTMAPENGQCRKPRRTFALRYVISIGIAHSGIWSATGHSTVSPPL